MWSTLMKFIDRLTGVNEETIRLANENYRKKEKELLDSGLNPLDNPDDFDMLADEYDKFF